MPSKLILGLVGPIASGKGTVADYLKDNHHAAVFRFSSPLRYILNRIYIEQSRQNMQDLSLDLRKRFGNDILAQTIAQDIAKSPNQIVIVDGVRRRPDIKYLKALPEFKLISITADQEIRWQRMTKRQENTDDTQKTFEQFKIDEQAEAEQQIAEVSASADLTISNNETFEKLYRQVEKILRSVKNSLNEN